MNKTGNAALTIIIIVLALVILAFFLVDIAQRDCNSNNDCAKNAYCDSNHECHEYPNEIVIKENNFLSAAIVLGIALIIAAYIYRGGKIPFFKKKEEKKTNSRKKAS